MKLGSLARDPYSYSMRAQTPSCLNSDHTLFLSLKCKALKEKTLGAFLQLATSMVISTRLNSKLLKIPDLTQVNLLATSKSL